jgi:glycosyltransferase involved in cell wall biosynthesis
MQKTGTHRFVYYFDLVRELVVRGLKHRYKRSALTSARNNAAQAVSIVIPAYTCAKTLGLTLRSVLAQSSSEWEAIIVDDGSEDRTRQIALEFANKDSRFRVLSQPHTGVSAARNAGIEAAAFPWLLFLDADDQIHSPFLEVCTNELAKDNTLDGVYSRWRRICEAREFPDKSELVRGDLFPHFAVMCVLPYMHV